jgi:predicted transglutaminase-like cysteine proteinase
MFTVALSVLLAASSTAAATTAAPTQAAPQAAEAPKAERKICKREEATESRLGGKRVCLTAQQWRERQRLATTGLGDVTK